MSFQRITISGSMRSSRNSAASASRKTRSPSSSSDFSSTSALLDPGHPLQVRAREGELLDRLHDDRALLHRVLRRQLDAVEAEQVGCLLEVVDDVVDLGREEVDVLAVERGQVLGVEERDQLAHDRVAGGLGRLHLLLRDAGVGVLAETAFDQARDLERVFAGRREEGEELGGAWGQGDLHAGGRLTHWRHL